MLHSFWFTQTVNAFTTVTQTDPDCAMGYWGLAVGQRGNPLVGAPTTSANQAASTAIAKAKSLGAKTARERDYVAAIETYFKDWETVDHTKRVVAYEQAMEDLYRRYPSDPESATLYALALNEAITVLPADKTYTRHLKAAGILEKVLAVHPDHPGALHYLIHSYDFPPLANRGLAAARRYETVASSAPHALHMPSHIYSMVGMSDASIASNHTALNVAKTYVHAMDFTMYAYLQTAQDGAARRMVEQAAALLKTNAAANLTPTAGILSVHTAFAAIPARFALERGAWAEAAALQERPGSRQPRRSPASHGPSAPSAAATSPWRAPTPNGWQRSGTSWSAHNKNTGGDQVEIQRLAAVAWIAAHRGSTTARAPEAVLQRADTWPGRGAASEGSVPGTGYAGAGRRTVPSARDRRPHRRPRDLFRYEPGEVAHVESEESGPLGLWASGRTLVRLRSG